MEIQIAHTAAAIAACYPVMQQLRPHIAEDEFVVRVRGQGRAGYRLAFISEPDGQVTAVAGFRIGENLAWRRFLYVDDLVTRGTHRSKVLTVLKKATSTALKCPINTALIADWYYIVTVRRIEPRVKGQRYPRCVAGELHHDACASRNRLCALAGYMKRPVETPGKPSG